MVRLKMKTDRHETYVANKSQQCCSTPPYNGVVLYVYTYIGTYVIRNLQNCVRSFQDNQYLLRIDLITNQSNKTKTNEFTCLVRVFFTISNHLSGVLFILRWTDTFIFILFFIFLIYIDRKYMSRYMYTTKMKDFLRDNDESFVSFYNYFIILYCI